MVTGKIDKERMFVPLYGGKYGVEYLDLDGKSLVYSNYYSSIRN